MSAQPFLLLLVWNDSRKVMGLSIALLPQNPQGGRGAGTPDVLIPAILPYNMKFHFTSPAYWGGHALSSLLSLIHHL